MHAILRLAVLPRDIAALEAPVEHRGMAGHRARQLEQLVRQPRVAALAIGRAEVEIRQLAFEEARQHRADRMRIPQRGGAVPGLQSRQFRSQRLMVWAPDRGAARGDFRVVGAVAAIGVQRRLVEGVDRAQAGGVLAGIQVGIVGRAVQVDHVARMRGDQHRGAEFAGKAVQAFQVPVGVGHGAGLGGEALRDRSRQVRADVRHRYQQRARAAMQGEGGGIGGEGHCLCDAVGVRPVSVCQQAGARRDEQAPRIRLQRMRAMLHAAASGGADIR
ncbi:hypothetical protein D9M72_316720 [compost metagenome]